MNQSTSSTQAKEGHDAAGPAAAYVPGGQAGPPDGGGGGGG
jgi:hypothetical protein